MRRPGVPSDWAWEAAFDGGELGCGELLIDLRLFVGPLRGGTRVLVTARDAGAPVEMPAWCRLTSHRLLGAAHPHYLVERRTDPR